MLQVHGSVGPSDARNCGTWIRSSCSTSLPAMPTTGPGFRTIRTEDSRRWPICWKECSFTRFENSNLTYLPPKVSNAMHIMKMYSFLVICRILLAGRAPFAPVTSNG